MDWTITCLEAEGVDYEVLGEDLVYLKENSFQDGNGEVLGILAEGIHSN